VKTETFHEFHTKHRTRGIVYLPTTSYIEMNEWTLPAPSAAEFAKLVKREKSDGTFERHKPFVRGGIWKNFLSRYPEANWMHKRMCALSRRFDRWSTGSRTTSAASSRRISTWRRPTTPTGTASSAACTCRTCAAGSTSRW
jgi:alpha-amylase/alpha-mannosidase (GH57 family)